MHLAVLHHLGPLGDLGGDDLRTLFVTSGRKGRPAAEIEQRPASGTVISMRVDVPGLPVSFFED